MKCEACLPLLEEYIDSELSERDATQVRAHLITCASCANELDTLSAEQEVYLRYDRALEVSPSMWNTVAGVIAQESQLIVSRPPLSLRQRVAGLFVMPSFGVSFAGAMAVLIVAAVMGLAYLNTYRQPPRPQEATGGYKNKPPSIPSTVTDLPAQFAGTVADKPNHNPAKGVQIVAAKSGLAAANKARASNQSDVLFPDAAYADIEDQDAQRHIEQAQNLLRSVRNLQVAEGADDIDVSYEKALSRRLLNENVILRRDAEMSGKFPVKTLLSSLEPFLIDIANLPDRTSADDLRVIKDRVQKTEIVAALHTF